MLQFVASHSAASDHAVRRRKPAIDFRRNKTVPVPKCKTYTRSLVTSSTYAGKPQQAPRCVREARVVVVGGGPVGTVAACMLWFRGVKEVMLLEKETDFQSLSPFRSYALGLFPRGLNALKVVPGLNEFVSGAGASLRKLTSLDEKGELKTIDFPPPFWSVRYFLRNGLLSCLKSFVLDQTSVITKYGADVKVVRYKSTGVELKVEIDGTAETLFCDLMIAADGRNSLVVSSLQEADQSTVKSKRGFDRHERMSAAVGLKVKSIILNPDEIKKAGLTNEDLASSLVTLNSAVSSRPIKERVKLGTFPAPQDQVASFGGILGVMVNPENSLLWSVRTVDEFYKLLQRNFPSVNVRNLVTEDRVETFLHTKPGVFPPITRVASLTASVGSGSGVIILGDAAHSFPPDTGLGVNSGFEDVAYLAAALDSLPKDATVHDVLAEYERLNDRETSALVYIAQVASPFQYGNAPLRRKIHTLNGVFRSWLVKRFPSLLDLPLNNQVLTLRPYSEMVRRDRRSVQIIVSVSLAIIATIATLTGYAYTYLHT